MMAARAGSGTVVELLLAAGVPCRGVFDALGRTARDVACEACVMSRDAYQSAPSHSTIGRKIIHPCSEAQRFQYRPDVAVCAMMLAWSCGCCLERDANDGSSMSSVSNMQTEVSKEQSQSHISCTTLPWILVGKKDALQLHRQHNRVLMSNDSHATQKIISISSRNPVLPGPNPSSIQSNRLPIHS